MRDASICGLGQTASSALLSAVSRWRFYVMSDPTVGLRGPRTRPWPRFPCLAVQCRSAAAQPARREIEIQIDGKNISVPEGATILDAARNLGIDTPTLCFLENLTPVNVCRVCVVELEGSRTLVPACSRKVEPGMKIKTDSERVRLSRKIVLEFLASSVDVSTAPAMQGYMRTVWRRSRALRRSRNATLSSRPRSIMTFTFATTRNAFFATSAWKPAEWMRKILSRSASRDADSPRISPPNSMFRCPIPPASTAGIVSVFAPPAR